MRATDSKAEVGLGRVRPGEQQVGTNGRVEDMRLLAREGELSADVVLPVLTEVVAVQCNPPTCGVEETEQEVRHGRLADTARPDERDAAARLEAKIEIRDDR